MATIKEIAELAGVSTTTVSYALNRSGSVSESTRRKILRIVEEIGYQPNKTAVSLRTSKTRTIGVVAEDLTVFVTPEIVDGICEYAEQAGYHIILDNLRVFHKVGNSFQALSHYHDEIRQLTDATLHDTVDGILYVGIHCRDVAEIVSSFERPVACIYCYSSSANAYSFFVDDETAAFQATEHLIRLGHRRIAVLTGPVDSLPSQSRLRGYQKAILQNDIVINPHYFQVGDWSQESGYELAKRLFSLRSHPTAVFSLNDYMAFGVLQAAKEASLSVPEDVSVIGFDNQPVSRYCTPALSTLAPPLRELGSGAAASLIDLLEGRAVPRKGKAFACQYVERQSVAKARR